MKLYRNTKSLVDNETEEAALEQMEASAKIISANAAARLIGKDSLRVLIEASSWDTRKEFLADWSNSYSRSTIHGKPCVIVSTAETDFIFMDEQDSDELSREFHSEITQSEWTRAQAFGPKHDTPQRS